MTGLAQARVQGRGARRHAEDGAIAIVTIFSLTLFTTGVLAGLAAAADLSLAAARARTAADAAALAGMGASPLVAVGTERTAEEAAREVARANNARLVEEDTDRWPLRYAVTVEVEPATAWVRRLVGPVQAKAVGAVRPRRH